jgi:hypothetical protein
MECSTAAHLVQGWCDADCVAGCARCLMWLPHVHAAARGPQACAAARAARHAHVIPAGKAQQAQMLCQVVSSRFCKCLRARLVAPSPALLPGPPDTLTVIPAGTLQQAQMLCQVVSSCVSSVQGRAMLLQLKLLQRPPDTLTSYLQAQHSKHRCVTRWFQVVFQVSKGANCCPQACAAARAARHAHIIPEGTASNHKISTPAFKV